MLDSLISKLASVEDRFNQIEELMARPDIAADYERVQELAKERASIEGLVSMYREHRDLIEEKEDVRAILTEGSDTELTALAKAELQNLEERLEILTQKTKIAMLPKDPREGKNVIVEIREGVGGEEASLFAADLYRMYTRLALLRGWDVEPLSSSPTDRGGFKEIVFEVRGKDAYSRLKYEMGGHRVQRVPVTEASGRIHTSTSTVAVLPEPDEVEFKLNADELRIDVYHAGGHGGQNVNKVATAIRVTHVPTGTVAVCQDERSQFKNKQKALAILRSRLYEAQQRKQESEIVEARRAQVGTGERAEKVRTYNFPQDRVTDHRIGSSFPGIQQILDGSLDPITDALAAAEQASLLEQATA